MLFIKNKNLSILNFYFFPREADDAFNIIIIRIMRRAEDDNVAALRRSKALSEKRIIDGFVYDEVFAKTVLARFIQMIERIAHGRPEDLERRNEIGPHRIDEYNDHGNIYQKISKKIEGWMFFSKAVKDAGVHDECYNKSR